jgi:UDP-2-acetamido-2,6-beta-L-arabino-hexul-4-ose reductase
MSGLKIAVTGAGGFVGKNLMLRLAETKRHEGLAIEIDTPPDEVRRLIASADAVINLAGVNRPPDPSEFMSGNVGPVEALIEALEAAGRAVPVIHVSSARASDPTPYGESKKAAEDVLFAFSERTGTPVHVFRLHNVFGKWCRPNYNSAVATFCHNIARGLPIRVDNPAAALSLVYIDDVIDAFLALLDAPPEGSGFREVPVVYTTTVGQVADTIRGFRTDRDENLIDQVGTGLTRALYATYVSSLPKEEFAYEIVAHRDPRGSFSEMLKTRTAGQFSYFTALPGVTRGGHYHHTKTEKFLVVHGKARFKFRHMATGETHEVMTSGDVPTVVETVPGWTHDITNVGEDVMVSMLWANEIFDRAKPDTIQEKV